jgi:oligoribonuclease NrnB/cAMP/cGMP phosphodiesterase (DHH superfamily)
VYLVDFSYKRGVVEQMLPLANRVVLIDHHKTALDDLAPLIESNRIESMTSLDHSGAVLAWMWFHGNDLSGMPKLLAHIEDRDLWRFALPGTREIQAAVFSYPYDFDLYSSWMISGLMNTPEARPDWENLQQNLLDRLENEGSAIERKHHKDIAELVHVVSRPMKIGGYVVPMANLPYTLTSDAGHLLAKGHPFAGCYWDTPKGRVFSLRSQDDGLDVGAIAKQYGGGGHVHASGFRVGYQNLAQFEPA